MNNSKIAGTTYGQEAQVILQWFKKFLQMSSYQIIIIFIVNKKNVNQVVIFDKCCMYREFKSYILSVL